jgi:PAS domain S-box-containing protein/putative nucleotidyltransferase with HDIG domain
MGLPPSIEQEIRSRLSSGGGCSPAISSAATSQEFLQALSDPPELIIIGNAPPFGADEALAALQQKGLILPLIVIDPQPNLESMARLLQQGAADYLSFNQLDRIEAAAVMAVNRRVFRDQIMATGEHRYRTLVETMRDGLMAIDANAVITFVNLAMCRMLGYRSEELVGRNLEMLYDEENWAIIQSHLAKRYRGISSSYEVHVTAKNGRQIPILISASPLLSKDGAFMGSMAIYTDLTEIRRAEGRLRKAASEWRQCFDALDDMLVVIDEQFRVQRCNKAMSDYLGLEFSQILGQSCYRLLHDLDEPPSDCLQRKMLRQGGMQTGDYISPKSGKLFSVTVSPITDTEGNTLGSVHLFKDVTEHRRREQERVEMAHELTRGLESTTLALTNMVDSRDPYTSGHSQRVAELALKVGSHMGMSEEDLRGLKFCGLLHDIGKGSIPLDILNKPGQLTEHEQGIIREHPVTAYHILENISFPWPVARVVYEHHERLDGSGYPQGLKGEEIHPWARLLAVCDVLEAMTSHRPYRPAHRMQDAFRELQEGAGEKFDLEVVQAALESLGVDDRRVMLVDDDAGVLDVYTTCLKRGNYETLGFSDPNQAVEAFVQDPTPILVTDLKMPGKSGLEVLREAKQAKPDTEVIVVTGHVDKESVVAAMRMGASDFLEKPVQMAELLKAVDRARERYNKSG